jgi:hypothetical protein
MFMAEIVQIHHLFIIGWKIHLAGWLMKMFTTLMMLGVISIPTMTAPVLITTPIPPVALEATGLGKLGWLSQ